MTDSRAMRPAGFAEAARHLSGVIRFLRLQRGLTQVQAAAVDRPQDRPLLGSLGARNDARRLLARAHRAGVQDDARAHARAGEEQVNTSEPTSLSELSQGARDELKNVALGEPLWPGDTLSHKTARELSDAGYIKRDKDGNWIVRWDKFGSRS